jgi:hypothetical protein
MGNIKTPPPMPAKLRGKYDVSPYGMTVRYRPGAGPAGFLLVWLIGWTVGCVLLAYKVFVEQEWMTIVFAIPFWAAWIFVFVLVVGMFTRRQRLEVDEQGLRYIDRAVFALTNRHVPREEFRKFAVGRRRKSDGEESKSGLEVRTTGKPLFLFPSMPDGELRWLAHQLSQLIEAAEVEESATVVEDSLGEKPRELAVTDDAVEPPSDTNWRLTHEFDSMRFVQRGRWSWTGVFGLLFLCAFWNGIVLVFVGGLLGITPEMKIEGGEWWALFFFLIPFELIGLVFLAALVMVVLEPVRYSTWHFEPGLITYRYTYFGLGPRWMYPFEALGRVELTKRNKDSRAKQQPSDETPYGLSLVRPDNTELCAVGGLTQGEARWLADTLMREWPQWFRR